MIGGIAYLKIGSNMHSTFLKKRDSAHPAHVIDKSHVVIRQIHTHKKDSSPHAVSSYLPTHYLLQVQAQSQLPQLPDGCEVTSLSMLLQYAGHPESKMILAKDMPKDPTKEVVNSHGVIVDWGNPNVGFVGDVYSSTRGYGIYHGPITKLFNQMLPGRAEDMTGQPFINILRVVASGRPVVLWTTATFQQTNQWEIWMSPQGPVLATPEEHAVLLVGYNQTELFVNNPLNGDQAQPVNRQNFIQAWHQLGSQAVTYTVEK